MTANPVKPARYRPGKPLEEEHSSSLSSEASEADGEAEKQAIPPSAVPPPPATSFPASTAKIASNLRNVNLNERRAQAAAAEAARLAAEEAARAKEEEGFVTAESSSDEEDKEGGRRGTNDAESGSEEESSSSEDEAPKLLLRPTFIKKPQRETITVAKGANNTKTDDAKWAEEESRRRAKADELVQTQLEKNAAARAAGKKYWDDDDNNIDADGSAAVDDTDGLDPAAEFAAWKLRELKRIQRERSAIELAEKEREEVERRRNLSATERDAEDKAFLDRQKEDHEEGRGKMGYLQKYHHKGAFFQDDAKAQGLDRRDLMGSRYEDEVAHRELLPEYMQIRDMTKLGRKGRTKYKDLRSEDTGRWGAYDGRGKGNGVGMMMGAGGGGGPRGDRYGDDERFQPDRDGGGSRGGASGANATQVRERKRAPDGGAPEGPGADDGARRRRPEDDSAGGRREESHRSSGEGDRDRDRDRRRRRRSDSRSRSPSPRRDRRREEGRERRKRSPSPIVTARRHGDKRRRVDVT